MKTNTGHADDYVARGIAYAKRVVAGKAGAGRFEVLSCKRFLRDLKKAKANKSKKSGFIFDPWEANNACDFAEKLQHTKGTWPKWYKLTKEGWRRQRGAHNHKFNVWAPSDLPPEETGWWYQGKKAWEPSENDGESVYVRTGTIVRVDRDPYIMLEDEQVFLLINIFGFRRALDGLRRFTHFYVEMARKNAKSTTLAIIMLYCFVCEGEEGPELYSGATTYKQARVLFDMARAMIKKDPDLREHFGLEVLANSIVCHKNDGFWQPVHANAGTLDGLSPHAVSLDEVHAHKTPDLFNVLDSAQGARSNPLMAMITTAGYLLDGIGYSTRASVVKILEDVLEAEHFFGIIYTLDKGDDPFDPKVWRKANPLLGISVSKDYLKRRMVLAKSDPKKAGEFKTKHCNLWLNSSEALINMEYWQRCAREEFVIELGKSDLVPAEELADKALQQIRRMPSLKGASWNIGADLADRNDMASVVAEAETEHVIVWLAFNFLPRELVDARAHDVTAHYKGWAETGQLILTDGDYIDHRFIKKFASSLYDGLSANRIGFDQFGGSQQIVLDMVDDGIDAVIVKKSAATYTDPTNDFLARIETQKFQHGGCTLLDWQASNVVGDFRTDGSVLPKKEHKTSKNKIDAIDAGLIASLLRLEPAEDDETIEEGFVEL